MNEGLISKRYAKALYLHAADLGEETLLYHRMQILSALLRQMPALSASLKSPMVAEETKLSLLKDATGSDAEPSYHDFIALIAANHRMGALLMIALSYQKIYRQKKNIHVVHLVSAKELPDDALERIRRLTEQITHGNVEFSNRIDPSIDGGFVLHLNDYRIDASVRGQLDQIDRQLKKFNKSII